MTPPATELGIPARGRGLDLPRRLANVDRPPRDELLDRASDVDGAGDLADDLGVPLCEEGLERLRRVYPEARRPDLRDPRASGDHPGEEAGILLLVGVDLDDAVGEPVALHLVLGGGDQAFPLELHHPGGAGGIDVVGAREEVRARAHLDPVRALLDPGDSGTQPDLGAPGLGVPGQLLVEGASVYDHDVEARGIQRGLPPRWREDDALGHAALDARFLRHGVPPQLLQADEPVALLWFSYLLVLLQHEDAQSPLRGFRCEGESRDAPSAHDDIVAARGGVSGVWH